MPKEANMHRRISFVLPGLGALLLAGILPLAHGQPAGPKPPHWTHAFDLKCRTSAQPVFDEKTKAWGFEVFKDDNTNNGVYILENGNLAAVKGFEGIKPPIAKSKTPEWAYGLDLKVRRADEPNFTTKTQVFGVEVFRDENTGNLVAINEKGGVSVVPGGKNMTVPLAAPRAPTWSHGLDLKVRKAGEKEFGKETKVYSIEVFKDENTGCLIYVCETGAMCLVPGFADAAAPIVNSKGPDWMHGLDLKCRKGGVKDFTPDTKVLGIEIFRDANNDNWIYLTQEGSLAVLPGNKAAKSPTASPKEPQWSHGLDLKVRKAGEPEFTAKTRIYGIEVFRDENTGCTLYLCETGAITAIATK